MSDKSKLVYICSPYATGDVQDNVEKAKEYCKLALKNGYIPVAPHLLYPQFLRDDDPEEREQGLSCGLALLEVCAEVWVFGDPGRSEGMRREIEYARNRKKKVVFMNLKEYILREDALNIPFTSRINDNGLCYLPLRDVTSHLLKVPAADVRKIAHGCWKKRLNTTESPDYTFYEWYCSVCECVCEDADKKPTYHYCPVCGAEMDMEDNE